VAQGNRTEVLNLDGAAWTPMLVSDDATGIVDQRAWAPNGAPWLSYRATPAGVPVAVQVYGSLQLWNAKTGKSSRVALQDVYALSAAWAPDGRALAIIAKDTKTPPVSTPLLWQWLEDEAPGPLWSAEGVNLPPYGSAQRDLVFQP